MTAPLHRRAVCAAITAATIFAGLAWRMAPLHLSYFLWKYGGSALWAIAVYWAFAAVMPRARGRTIACLASLFALAVELSRLVASPALETFRLTLAGRLILGRVFSARNILAYWLAIVATTLVDHYTRPSREAVPSR